jgi:hypothetical protein
MVISVKWQETIDFRLFVQTVTAGINYNISYAEQRESKYLTESFSVV